VIGRLASGRDCVKQRPNLPNSVAKTSVLRHILLYYFLVLSLFLVAKLSTKVNIKKNILLDYNNKGCLWGTNVSCCGFQIRSARAT
jgi:hypothetical protein